ncbi:MAG: MSMEG_0565 family glycosyltransferase, partial [Actinomycetota bacterium]
MRPPAPEAGPGRTPGRPGPRVALVTYTTRPRGGPVHTLHLAESLARLGQPVHVFALGNPDAGFFRKITVPHTIHPAPEPAGTLEERVLRSVDVLGEHLKAVVPGAHDIVHAQDCIAASAACQLKKAVPGLPVVRTVHHVDDFSIPALVACQHRSILEPDHVLVVSRYWQRWLQEQYGVEATVVTNGVDGARFGRPPVLDASELRARLGADGRFMFLTVGGLEPRKGSLDLIEALAMAKAKLSPPPVLVVVGGHSFQDHSHYRERVLERARHLRLDTGGDLIRVGTVADGELARWYHAADAFVFPSLKEGWGLAVLEAMAAGLPVIATDIPVFREYLTGEKALLVPPEDPQRLAAAMVWLATDPHLR